MTELTSHTGMHTLACLPAWLMSSKLSWLFICITRMSVSCGDFLFLILAKNDDVPLFVERMVTSKVSTLEYSDYLVSTQQHRSCFLSPLQVNLLSEHHKCNTKIRIYILISNFTQKQIICVCLIHSDVVFP